MRALLILFSLIVYACSGSEKPAAPPREHPSVLSCAQQVMIEAGCWGSGQPEENRVFCSDPDYQDLVREKIKERCQ